MFKKIIYTIILVSGAMILSFFGVISNVFGLEQNGLINYYNLENSNFLLDSKGTNNLTIGSKVDLNNVNFIKIKTLYGENFADSDNGYKVQTSNQIYFGSNWTIEARVKINGYASLEKNRAWGLYSLNNGSNTMNLFTYIDYTTSGYRINFNGYAGDNYKYTLAPYNSNYTDYSWRNLTQTYNNGILKTYVNGVLVNTSSYTITANNYYLTIGPRRYSYTGMTYGGSENDFDYVAVYNTTLSDSQILNNYNATIDPFANYTKYTFTDNQLLLNAPINEQIEIYLPYGVVESTGTTINLYRKDNDLLVSNLPINQFDIVQMGQNYYYKIDTTILDPNYYIMLTKNTGSYDFYATANITNYNKYSTFNILTLSGNTQYLLKGTDTIGKLLIDKNTFNTNNMKLYIYDRELNIVLEKLLYKSYDSFYYYIDLNFNAFKDLELYIGIDSSIQFDLLINNNWNITDLPTTPIGVPTDPVEKEKQNFFDNINNFINDNIEGINKFKEFLSLLYTNLPTLVRTIISFVYSLTWVKLLVGVIKS